MLQICISHQPVKEAEMEKFIMICQCAKSISRVQMWNASDWDPMYDHKAKVVIICAHSHFSHRKEQSPGHATLLWKVLGSGETGMTHEQEVIHNSGRDRRAVHSLLIAFSWSCSTLRGISARSPQWLEWIALNRYNNNNLISICLGVLMCQISLHSARSKGNHSLPILFPSSCKWWSNNRTAYADLMTDVIPLPE